MIQVEVVYARPDRQEIVDVTLNDGASVRDAITASGIGARFPEIDMTIAAVGIFSRRVSLDAVLRDGDRVEIYRALIADPKQVRRQRAARGLKKKTARVRRG